MSLFIGNISRNLRSEDLEEEFDKIGPCSVNFKGSFAFVEYKDERDAEDAINELNGKDIGGQKLSIEWSKKSGRFDPKTSNAKASRRGGRDDRGSAGRGGDKGCYNCGKPGHFARDCRAKKRSRSRSYDKGRRDYRGGDSRGRRDSRSPNNRRNDSPRRDERRRKSRSGSDGKKTRKLRKEEAHLLKGIEVPRRGPSQDRIPERLRGQGVQDSQSNYNRLNNEADSIKQRLQSVEESKRALQNNRQFREAQEQYEQQIQMLESDKVSLMKRLNMVLSELEKATHEKAEINQKVLEQERMADELKKKLDEVSSLKNVVNRNLQEDLRYERDLNEKLKEELSRFEKEKESLLGKLKDQESLTNEIQRETNAINANLQRKTDELKRLEREHESNLTRLRELNQLLDTLRQQEMHSKNEKRRMEDELEDLTRERNELIRRMNELSDRYEDYVSTMNRERIEIMKANKNHVKLLTAKLLFQILSESIHQRRKDAIQEMRACSSHISKMELKMQKFARIMWNYHVDRKRTYLRRWYRSSMNFVHENYKKLNLIDFNVNKKRKIKFYYKWRQAFLQNKTNYDSKIDSLKVLRHLLQGRQDLNLRKYLCKWRDFVELRQYQQDFMLSIMNRKRQRKIRSSFVRWLAIVKKQQMDERYDSLSDLVTNLWFKQRVFLALRQATLESKSENSMLKFRAWKDWCETARKKKYFQRKKVLVDRLNGQRDERLLKQCFDAIRFSNIQDHYESTKARLEQEIPVREELEKKRDQLIKTNRTKDKYNLFRQMCIRYTDLKYRALMLWKENVEYYNRTMNRTKLRLIELHKRNLSQAFFKWKETIDKKHMVEMVAFTEDLVNENQELTNTLQQCQREKEKLMDCTGRQQGLKLERIRNMLNRNLMRRKFELWAQNAFYVCSLEDAIWKSSKTIQRRKLRNAFNKYKKQVQEAKRLEYIKNKVEWFGSVRDHKAIDSYWANWKEYVKRQQNAKKFLVRSIKGIDKIMKNESFSKWKNYMYSMRRQVYLSNIEELGRRQEEHDAQIKELSHQIQVNDCTQKHLESKLQSQSHKIMANFISRFIHSSLARGFYTWTDVLKDHKTKQRFLKSTLLYWIKNSQGKAFRTWAEFSLKAKEHELATKLKAREEERRNLQKQKEEEEKQQNGEIEKLSYELNEALNLKEQLKTNYEKALETHINRIKNNVYIDKRQNIFCVWADFIKREKNAINVIGAIARKQLRMEVFSRIRLVARERYLEHNAEKIMTNFFRMFKQSQIKKAFSTWRVKTYGEVVQEMNQKKELLIQTRQQQQAEMEQMQLQKQNKAIKILKQRGKREIINAWINIAKVLKALRVKQELLNQNMRYMQIRQATRKWHLRTKKTNYLRRRDQQVVRKYQLITAKRCYQAWAERARITKLLGSRVAKFVKRLQYVDLADGFSQIVHYSKSFEERIKERKEHGQVTIQKILSRLLKNRVADAFLSLKTRSFKKDFKENYFARMVKHVYLYRMKHFFGKWRHNADRIKLAETINVFNQYQLIIYLQTEGDVVLERNEMRRNVKALKDFLVKQGYNEQEIQQYLDEKTDKQKSNMHRAIVGLFFKKSDFKIMPKAFNQWKRWIEQRKLMKQWAQFTVNALNHPLFWAFRKWKMQEENAKSRLKAVPKKDLIDKIISDEMAIGSAQSRLERMDEAIDNLNIQRESLLNHYISGQKLAIALGKNNHQKSLYRAFIRWKKYSKDFEQELLAEQLERTNQMINDLMMHVQKLENINRNLSGENEELRQAALDGIEIAKAVQELTKEREQLSQDLQDRATTIKKLIEDNNNLGLRLSIAQKEAEQLEQLNQQSYLAPPEKDRYY